MRLVIGFVAQPFVAAVCGFMLFPLIYLTLNGGMTSNPVGAAMSIALGAALAAVPVTVFGAVPAVMWLRKRGPLSAKQILWGGAILGNLPFAVIMPLAIATNNVSAGASVIGLFRSVVFGSLFGVVGATAFWAIAIRGTAMETRGRPSDRPREPYS